jgi:prepilin-type N-terminal cleavage/methylation domain-containing protein
MSMITTKHIPPQGFTLIETMVAIAIISITLVTPFVAIEDALTASNLSRDELIGSMLSQEAVEYVREVRDNNYLATYNHISTPTWLAGFDGSTGTNCITHECTVDSTPLTPTPIVECLGVGNCPVLYLSTPTSAPTYPYFYNQALNGSPTRFTRSIRLVTISNTEVEVIATTSWSTDHRASSAVIHDYLDNWLSSQ